MSIDPLKMSGALVSQSQPPTRQQAADVNNKFAELLDTRVPRERTVQLAAVKAEQLLDLARLQLLQGLFVDDEEQGALLTSLALDSLPQPVTAAVPPRVDRLYRQMQPTLQEKYELERPMIERMIDRVAEQVSLAPELIRSVVATESDFQPQAVSPAGAQGLMQLMPATAQEMGVENSFDPQQNLLGGSRYLKQLLDKYAGDLDKALAAYNWGQGNVDRKGLAQMPEETRNYLAKVKGLLAEKG